MTIHIYFMVAGLQTPSAYHFSMSALAGIAGGRGEPHTNTNPHECLGNKIGVKKESGRVSGICQKKKQEIMENELLKPLSKVGFVKDDS